jgi:predicted DNA-binding helix-hairpin-helix protein
MPIIPAERLVRVRKNLRLNTILTDTFTWKVFLVRCDWCAKLYADRLSMNLEIPTESGLKLLAQIKPSRHDKTDAFCEKWVDSI